METDFKFLCKQLADDLSIWVECQIPPTQLPVEQLDSFKLLNRVYKALAEAKANEVKEND